MSEGNKRKSLFIALAVVGAIAFGFMGRMV